jgi:hypothetical protein
VDGCEGRVESGAEEGGKTDSCTVLTLSLGEAAASATDSLGLSGSASFAGSGCSLMAGGGVSNVVPIAFSTGVEGRESFPSCASTGFSAPSSAFFFLAGAFLRWLSASASCVFLTFNFRFLANCYALFLRICSKILSAISRLISGIVASCSRVALSSLRGVSYPASIKLLMIIPLASSVVNG